MADKVTSGELASVASRVLQIAQQGGPVRVHRTKLIDAMSQTGGGTQAVLDVFDRILRSYIDDAERLAASVLSQKE